ncbi:MAG: hypothetical protein HOP13_18600 [Alphaproteobacteria bacterium]|nr:hypothetical protein [Alphaproteobacteria bacterium]
MSPHLPEALADSLHDAFGRWGSDLHGLAYAMGFRIIQHFLGDAWTNANVRLHSQPSRFMLNEFDELSDNRFVHMERVTRLADALFRLMGCAGFEVLTNRFQQRDAKSCFYEAEVASDFVEDGFNVQILEERGKRGSDFDFVAKRDGVIINVEVTAKDTEIPSEDTFYSTLKSKRTQVPQDAPAILYVFLPPSWPKNQQAMMHATTVGAARFFRGSQRFNAVVVLWDVMLSLGEGMVTACAFHPFLHSNPRHAMPSLSFFGRMRPENSVQYFRDRLHASPEGARQSLGENPFNPPLAYVTWVLAQRRVI